MLKEICNDPYKVYKLVNNGYLTYNSFISPYADNKTKNIIKKIIYWQTIVFVLLYMIQKKKEYGGNL